MTKELIGAAKPTKPWPEMTEAEKDAFAEALFEQMTANKKAHDSSE